MAGEQTTLGDALNTERERRGISQADAARVSGAGEQQSTYQRWENDESFPDARYFEGLCAYLGVDLLALGGLIAQGQMRRHRRKEVR